MALVVLIGQSNRGFVTTSKGWAAFFDRGRGAMPNIKAPGGGLPDATKIFAKKWCDSPPLSPLSPSVTRAHALPSTRKEFPVAPAGGSVPLYLLSYIRHLIPARCSAASKHRQKRRRRRASKLGRRRRRRSFDYVTTSDTNIQSDLQMADCDEISARGLDDWRDCDCAEGPCVFAV